MPLRFRRCRKLLKKIRKRLPRVKTTGRDLVEPDRDLVNDYDRVDDLVETDDDHNYDSDHDHDLVHVKAPPVLLLLLFLFYLMVVAF